jgi:hypothetical protein
MIAKLALLAVMIVPLAGCKDDAAKSSPPIAGAWAYTMNGDNGYGQVQWILRPDGSATIYAEDGANWASRPARWSFVGNMLLIDEAGVRVSGMVSWINANSFEFTCTNPGFAGSKLLLKRI